MLHRWNLAFILWALIAASALAHDPDDPALDEFYNGLMMPDAPSRSCCGVADAYFADSVEVNGGGQVIAIITDTRDDQSRRRRHIAPGTKFVVPVWKHRRPPAPNPTGHNVIFIGSGGEVYCWEPTAKG